MRLTSLTSSLRQIAFLYLLLVVSSFSLPAQDTLRILPLGNSITQGRNNGVNAIYNSYRRGLYQLLTQNGYVVDFVGSRDFTYLANSNDATTPPDADYDWDHEGHAGRRADWFLENGKLNQFLQGYTPDVALVHIGTNDMLQGQSVSSTLTDIRGMIDTLRKDNPTIWIYLAQILPVANTSINSQLNLLNDSLPNLKNQYSTAQSPIFIVDQNSGFAIATDTYDGVHANQSGETKMAMAWYEALIQTLPCRTPATCQETQPRAFFEIDQLTGTFPLTVQVDASSSTDLDGTIVQYQWDWDDGATSAGVQASHTFNQAGTYQIQLVVTDDSSAQDTFSQTIEVVAPADQILFVVGNDELPSKDDTYAYTRLLEQGYAVVMRADEDFSLTEANQMGLVVISTSIGVSQLASQIAQITAPLLTWEHKLYKEAAFANVDGALSGTNETDLQLTGVGHPLAAGLSGSTSVYTNAKKLVRLAPVGMPSLIGNLAGDPTQSVLFGYEAGATMNNGFTAPARRTGFFLAPNAGVFLNLEGWQLFDAAVCWTKGECGPVSPVNQAPIASFSATPPTGTAPLLVQLNASNSLDPDGTILSYDWDLGDGATGTGQQLTHSYTTEGNFTIQLIVTDDSSATDTSEFMLTVLPDSIPPLAVCQATPLTGTAPLTVQFDGSMSSDANGTIQSHYWTYGTGSGDSLALTSHTYTQAGTYLVQLIVLDNEGLRDTCSLTIQVDSASSGGTEVLMIVGNAASPGNEDLWVKDQLEQWGYQVSLIDDDGLTGNEANGNDLIILSTSIKPAKVGSLFTQSAVPLFTWEHALYKELQFATQDGSLTGSTYSDLSIVAGSSPLAAGLTGNVSVFSPAKKFVSLVPEGNPTIAAVLPDDASRAILFGYEVNAAMAGGSLATARRTAFFTGPGTMPKLTSDGITLLEQAICWTLGTCDSTSPPPLVNQLPQADFTFSPASGLAPLAVSFDASASHDPDGILISYAWDFGDGNTGTGLMPGHLYSTPGIYSIQLVVTDDSSATDTATQSIIVTDPNGPEMALLVAGRSVNPSSSDLAIQTRLESLGLSVTILDDDSLQLSATNGMQIVVISSTVKPGKVGSLLSDISVPLLTWEHLLYKELYFGSSDGSLSSTTFSDLSLFATPHPLAAGLSGTQTVFTTAKKLVSIVPEGNPVAIASRPDDSNQVTIFGYETGSVMAGGQIAPARRTGFFLSPGSSTKLSLSGWELFDAAICWTANLNCSPPARKSPQSTDLQWTLAPNPFQQSLQLQLDGNQSGIVQLRILNLQGQTVSTQQFIKPSGFHRQKLSLPGLADGLYLLEVRMGDFRAVQPIWKQGP